MTGELSDDPQSFLTGLVDSVNRALPDAVASGLLTVDRDRSLGDRLAGRPGTITGLRLEAGGEVLTLASSRGPKWNAEAARISGGVIISRRTLTLGDWLSAFAGRVAASAADAAGDAAASARALQSLGLQSAGADLRIDEGTLLADLRMLPAKLAGWIPGEAIASVERISALVTDALPRVAGNTEAEFIVSRTATDYLPSTLRAYLSLPADWVRGHVFPDGQTPEQSFLAQLATIEDAARKMQNAAVEQDAAALLINGRFLTDRFAPSSIDLG
ncbi:hypothetical protein BH09ACT1_BH09ACT1_09270 [soil metagenome]